MAALLSLGTSPLTEETLKEMKGKHPAAELPTVPSGPTPTAVRFDAEVVRKKVDGFPAGSAAGASGTRLSSSRTFYRAPTRLWGRQC